MIHKSGGINPPPPPVCRWWPNPLVKEQCRLDMRNYSFSLRVMNDWNKLPNDCVNASSMNMFKNRIDRYLIRAGYT